MQKYLSFPIWYVTRVGQYVMQHEVLIKMLKYELVYIKARAKLENLLEYISAVIMAFVILLPTMRYLMQMFRGGCTHLKKNGHESIKYACESDRNAP
jgi:hypothetical protein